MSSSTTLFRIRQAARLCRYGASIIAIVGAAVAIYFAFFVINGGPGSLGNAGETISQGLISCGIALLIAIPIAFFALHLFALGALLDYLSGKNEEEKEEETADDHLEIVSLSKLP